MYLTRVALDPRRRTTMIALSNPQQFHGAIERSYPGERRRRLWRLDTLRGNLYLLVLSEDPSALEPVVEQFGAGTPAESKSYAALLDRIAPGSPWQFRLTANPTISRAPESGPMARGKVFAHITPTHQKAWLQAQGEKHGFRLSEDGFDVTDAHWLRFRKGHKGPPVSLLSVTWEGTLEVTDADAFRQTLTEGIGRGKAYGMGLLTVARGEMRHG